MKILFQARNFSYKKYTPSYSQIPPTPKKHLEFLWRRPDPVPLPKTLQVKLDDNSTFHTFVKREPLYKFLPENPSESLLEKVLPPKIYGARVSSRLLSSTEIAEIKKIRTETNCTVVELAEKYNCAVKDVAKLFQKKKYSTKYRWYFTKRYKFNE
jgi:hypothetical protein